MQPQMIAPIDQGRSALEFLHKMAEKGRFGGVVEFFDGAFGDDAAVICLDNLKVSMGDIDREEGRCTAMTWSSWALAWGDLVFVLVLVLVLVVVLVLVGGDGDAPRLGSSGAGMLGCGDYFHCEVGPDMK